MLWTYFIQFSPLLTADLKCLATWISSLAAQVRPYRLGFLNYGSCFSPACRFLIKWWTLRRTYPSSLSLVFFRSVFILVQQVSLRYGWKTLQLCEFSFVLFLRSGKARSVSQAPVPWWVRFRLQWGFPYWTLSFKLYCSRPAMLVPLNAGCPTFWHCAMTLPSTDELACLHSSPEVSARACVYFHIDLAYPTLKEKFKTVLEHRQASCLYVLYIIVHIIEKVYWPNI